jgi:CubicO group peptidase (beta-lactamase class C family)
MRLRAVGVAAALLGTLPSAEAAQTCPAHTWERVAPKMVGWSSGKLKKADDLAEELATESYLVAVGGRIIWEFGDTALATNVHSVRKGIASILLGIAADRGQIALERSLADLGIDDVGGLSDMEKTATVHQLLSARSCIYHRAAYETKEQLDLRPERYSCRPGERWFYNNWDFNVLGTIYEHISKRNIFDGFETELARPLQLEHFKKAEHTQFHREPELSAHPAYLFRLSGLDMARIGLLMSRGGDWCGSRIVSKRWVDQSTSKYSDTNRHTGYGYLWWVGEDGKQFGVQFQGRTFSARGSRGQFMVVNPAHDIVIVHRVDTDAKGQRVKTREFAELLAAIVAAAGDARTERKQ